MATIGSDGGFQADNRGGVIDGLGNSIISSDTAYNASPLGIAPLTQALYGIANANFNLTPPDPSLPIVANSNDLPYWTIENLSDDQITATTVFDDTTQTWAVKINPGTAATSSTLSLKTRSYLLNDDNLGLQQKAYAVLSKFGTAAVSTQWNLKLSATYYSSNDTALGTTFIGTVFDTGTWSAIYGATYSGTAVSASARYVDLEFLFSTTAAVTATCGVLIKSVLLVTTVTAPAVQQRVDTFTSSGTWTVPAGVTKVDVLAMGGGGGGASGAQYKGTSATYTTRGGGGGGGAAYVWAKGVDVSGSASITIGVGAGGSGGTSVSNSNGVNGSDGGASSFGTLVVAYGGSGGVAGSSSTGGSNTGGGGTGGIGGSAVGGFPTDSFPGKSGGNSAVYNGNGTLITTATNGTDSTLIGFSNIPFFGALNPAAGSNGGTANNNTGTAGTGGVAGISGGGGAGGMVSTSYTGAAIAASNGGAGGGGGGGAGGRATSQNITAGSGGTAGANSGAGGGGGGASAGQTGGTTRSGAGGDGGSGCFVCIVYVA